MNIRSLLLLFFLASASPALHAEQGDVSLAGIPPQIAPIIKNIQAKYSIPDLVKLIQTATPTGWKIVQEKAKLTEEGKPQGFTLADFEKLPEKEQQALVTAIQPVILEAIGKLTPQEQMQLLALAQDFQPDTIITPVMNLVVKKDPKK